MVLLGLNAPVETLAEGFVAAAGSRTCRGFAVGRTLFKEPAGEWLAGRIDDATFVTQARAAFERMITLWRQGRTTSHPALKEGAAA